MTSGRRRDRRQFLGACTAAFLAPSLVRAASQTLDVAYVNGRIWTGVPGARIAGAIGVAGSRIAAVDSGPVQHLTGKRTRVVDLAGAFVVPGFIDNHTHFLLGAATLMPPDLRQASTRQEARQADRRGCAAVAARRVGAGR